MREQVELGDRLPRPRHEVAQEGELLRRQRELLARLGRLVPDGIELERADAERRAAAAVAVPAQQRPRPRRELAQLEGLDEVVVRPVVEPGDPVVDAAARGQHQDPRLRRAVRARLGADRTADLAASDRGQVQVEADQVVGVDARLHERLVAGVGEVDGIPLAAEAGGDRVGQVLLVLDDKHAHP